MARIGVAAAIAGAATMAVRPSLSDGLPSSTDIVGFPIHSDFNVRGYFVTFYCAAVLFPLFLLAADLVLTRLLKRELAVPSPVRMAIESRDTATPVGGRANGVSLLARAALVGGLLGAGLGWIGASDAYWRFVVGGAVVYPSLLLVGLVSRRRRAPYAINAICAVATVGVLGGTARASVRVAGSDQLRSVVLIPGWLAVGSAAVLIGVVAFQLRRDQRDAAWRALERRVVGMVAGAVGVFVFLARMPGELPILDAYHEGEALAAFDLLRRGFLPWEGVLFIHGLMNDVIRPGLGILLVEDSRWGAQVGQALLLAPLYWALQYLLNRHLLGRNWALLVGSVLLIVNGWASPGDLRFTLQPLVLLSMAALLRRPSLSRALVFSSIGVVHWILTPEATFILIGCAMSVVGYEIYHRQGPARAWLRRTRWCAVTASALLGAWLLVLVVADLLPDYIFYFRTFAPDHELTGGVPFETSLPLFWYAALVPGAAAVLLIGTIIVRMRLKWDLAVQDWTALALAVFTLLYYRKFLSRADAHAFEVLAQALPLIYYVVALSLRGIGSGMSRASSRPAFGSIVSTALSLLLVVAAIAVWPRVSVGPFLSGLPSALRASVTRAPSLDRMGYAVPDAVDQVLLDDLEAAIDALAPADARVFDMTNGPAIFYYLLAKRPVSRYYHVSTAIRYETQLDLIRLLERERPALVVMDGSMGLPSWDRIPNNVRHYEVMSHVLARYEPILSTHNYLFLRRPDLPPLDMSRVLPKLSWASTRGLLEFSQPCDWSHAPARFSDPGWDRRGRASDVSTRQVLVLNALGWAQDPTTGGLPEDVVAVRGGFVIGRATMGRPRPDVAASTGNPALGPSGYEFRLEVPDGDLSDLRVFVVTSRGTAVELARAERIPGPRNSAPARLSFPGPGGSVGVEPGTVGSLDDATVSEETLATFPLGLQAADFTHLELLPNPLFGEGEVAIRPAGVGSNAILTKTRSGRAEPLVVRVDNCPQWHRVHDSFTLTTPKGSPVPRIRALR